MASPGGHGPRLGCGSGIAGRRVIGRFGANSFAELKVWDHSEAPGIFARQKAAQEFPGLTVTDASDFIGGSQPIGLLVISHVIQRAPAPALAEIGALVGRSRAVIWTEARLPRHEPCARGAQGSVGKTTLRFVAPCTHQNACPISRRATNGIGVTNFAAPPSFIFADSNWVSFGQRAGIDLRSLPTPSSPWTASGRADRRSSRG